MNSTTTVPTTISADPQVAEVADGTIGTYPAGRYRVNQISPATRFREFEGEWSISDFAAPDDPGGFYPVCAPRNSPPQTPKTRSFVDLGANHCLVRHRHRNPCRGLPTR